MMSPPPEGDAGRWQRLSPWALAFTIARTVHRTLRENIYLLLGAGAGSVFLEWLGAREIVLLISVLLLISVTGAVIHHRRFRFRLEEDAVRVASGLFERKELRIPFDRIMNVSSSQPFYFRPLGLVRLGLETPGAAQREVELPGIPLALAAVMRERIAEVRGREPGGTHAALVEERAAEAPGGVTAAASVAEGEPIYRARTGDLLLHGLSSNQIWVLAGALVSLFGFLESRIGHYLNEAELEQTLRLWFGTAGLGLVALALASLALLALVSMLISWLRFHDFTLWQVADRYRARGGLLDTREQTVPQAKLHGFTVVQTAAGRLLHRFYLIGRQAGVTEAREGGRSGRFLIPGLDGPHAFQVLGRLEPGTSEPPPVRPVDGAFRRVLWARSTLLLLPPALALAVVAPEEPWMPGSLLLLLALVLAGVHLRWRRWGHAEAGDFMWIRRGLLGQRLDVFRLDRAQQVQVSQSPVQRRRGLANLVVVLPHGPQVIPFLPLAEATALANQILWRAETAPAQRL